ncbi:HNH endonuclease signature motif containing protein [Hymenobacter guriensis]|uniref:Putative HNH nuclease YajD n=1 Tax=Hymenobacter guriensis TaxID=2793065 RepID=A0ABS0KYR5_9BACT|nr:HNH endonuclease [Hymenobacter guriensis]
MPTLPSSPRRPWQPKQVPKEYVAHAARSPEYSTARWQKARKLHLSTEPCCRECTKRGRTVVATVVDHILPVRLGGGFWDTRNYQSLCKPCHARKSQSERTIQPKQS